MKIKDIMSANVVTVAANATTKEAARLMHDLHLGSLPVLDDGKLVGFITDRDICCRVVATGHDAVMTQVKEVMGHEVISCREDLELNEAATLMAEKHIRRLAVLHDDNSLAGLVSVEDLARSSHELASGVLQATSQVH